MMAGIAYQEDVQSVLEQFVENVANLPAELAHLYEEMTAKDRQIADARAIIQQKDASIQRFIKQNGSSTPYAKEANYTAIVQKQYDEVETLQKEKCALGTKALELITRHIKRLDEKIKDLRTDGLLDTQPIITDAIRESLRPPKELAGVGGFAKLEIPGSARATPAAVRALASGNNTPISPAGGLSTINRVNVVDHMTASLQAAGNDAKRRRLTTQGLATPVNPSPLGTSTPTDVKDPSIRSNGDNLPARTSHTSRKAPNHPTKRNSGGSLQKTPRKRERDEEEADNASAGEEDDANNSASGEDEEGEEGAEDSRPYCTCRQISFGDMVACDDSDCPFEWFHWTCVGLTKEPVGKWYCPHCSKKRNGAKEEEEK